MKHSRVKIILLKMVDRDSIRSMSGAEPTKVGEQEGREGGTPDSINKGIY